MADDLLIFTGVLSPEQTHAGPTLTVKFDGKPLVVDQDAVRIPHADIPGILEIEADPNEATHFPIEGKFKYEGDGKLTPIDGTSKAHFAPVRSASTKSDKAGALPVTAMSMMLFFSRLRDVTFEALGFAAAGKNADFPETKDDLSKLVRAGAGINVLQDPPVAGGKLSFAEQHVAPKSDLTYFELRAEVPKMVAVLWPDAVPRTPDTASKPQPYLLYFHPNTGQNFPKHYSGDYPFSHDFTYYQVIRYVLYEQAFEVFQPNIQGDPLLHDPFWKGLAYQFEASGKPVVLVKPVSKPHDEIGSMMHADVAKLVLDEVGAYMFREAGVYPEVAPPIGRLALASFSASTSLAIQFLQKNKSHALVTDTLKEVYSFDAPGAFRFSWFNEVGKWLKNGEDKRARAYGRATHAQEFKMLLGNDVAIPSTTPMFVHSKDGTRTCATATNADWDAVSPMDVQFQEAHQLVSALMLTDALRRSGF